jgi:hypothetical protein
MNIYHFVTVCPHSFHKQCILLHVRCTSRLYSMYNSTVLWILFVWNPEVNNFPKTISFPNLMRWTFHIEKCLRGIMKPLMFKFSRELKPVHIICTVHFGELPYIHRRLLYMKLTKMYE